VTLATMSFKQISTSRALDLAHYLRFICNLTRIWDCITS